MCWVEAVSPAPTLTFWLPPTMMSKDAPTLITSRIEIDPLSVRRNEFAAMLMPASVRSLVRRVELQLAGGLDLDDVEDADVDRDVERERHARVAVVVDPCAAGRVEVE